ncbi:MAG: type II toxin-antitoxin system VapC family toxin [Gemmatimonadota bacterium]
MRRYCLDTQLYIEAARDREKAEQLKSFVSAALPFLFLHAVVVQELLAGATTPKWRREISRDLVGPFERRRRLLTPQYSAWKRSGEILADLVQRRIRSADGLRPSFMNDALLAASCRQAGVTLITRNTKDFEAIAKVERITYVPPWPGLR